MGHGGRLPASGQHPTQRPAATISPSQCANEAGITTWRAGDLAALSLRPAWPPSARGWRRSTAARPPPAPGRATRPACVPRLSRPATVRTASPAKTAASCRAARCASHQPLTGRPARQSSSRTAHSAGQGEGRGASTAVVSQASRAGSGSVGASPCATGANAASISVSPPASGAATVRVRERQQSPARAKKATNSSTPATPWSILSSAKYSIACTSL